MLDMARADRPRRRRARERRPRGRLRQPRRDHPPGDRRGHRRRQPRGRAEAARRVVAAVEAAVAAADAEGVPFALNARTDAFLRGRIAREVWIADAVERGRAYLDAGATCVFVPGNFGEDVVIALVAGIGERRVSLIGPPMCRRPARLQELGVARLSYGPLPAGGARRPAGPRDRPLRRGRAAPRHPPAQLARACANPPHDGCPAAAPSLGWPVAARAARAVRGRGPCSRLRVRPRREENAWRAASPSRSRGSASSSARSPPSTTSASPWSPGGSPGSSVRTAPARPRPCGCCSGSCARPPARPRSAARRTATSNGRSRPWARRSRRTSIRVARRATTCRSTRDRGGPARSRACRVVLDQVGLAELADRRVGGYSLGMRQRLALAYTLLGDPGVFVLDEPINGLDPEGIKWIRGFLQRLAHEGRTVLVSVAPAERGAAERRRGRDHLAAAGS